MELTNGQELILLGLLVAVAGLLVLAPVLRVPYPILLVLGGSGSASCPGAEDEMPPDLVLVGILPPLLYVRTYFTALRELR